jgi:hypothetical protein
MNVQQQLRIYDEKITERRQKIAVLQVEIAQIEDARRTALWLAEEPGAALSEHQQEILSGRSERPVMVVRAAAPEPQQQLGPPPATKPVKQRQPRKPYEKRKRAPDGGSFLQMWGKRALEFASDSGSVSSAELANFYGVPRDPDSRKPIQNAMYDLLRRGKIKRLGIKGKDRTTYLLVTSPANGGAHHAEQGH